MKRILYITYDGLSDPLGQSQILPYIKGLAAQGYQFTILSFEKKDLYLRQKEMLQKLTKESNIDWVPLWFTSEPPLLSKFYDAVKMRQAAVQLQKKEHFHMVHCRSYIAADAGLYLKKKFGIKFFFDMRGFWADEKKDGGSWNMDNPIFKRVYRYYKKKEAQYLHNADYIISLTEAGKKEMMRWPSYNKDVPLQVIPCCADMDHFTLTSVVQKKEAKASIGLEETDFVISYLGSVGTWYMLNEMLLLFKTIKRYYPSAKFLFVTHTAHLVIKCAVSELKLSPEDFIIREATRAEVPSLIKASDINLSFIKPVYSKISSSPTKLGEVLSMGIPVISNSGVGDVKEIIESMQGGFVLDGFTDSDFEKTVTELPRILKIDPEAIRNAASTIYSLELGINLYATAYDKVLG
jgi:glycosyltransferase involved in cell wall biosynthesis